MVGAAQKQINKPAAVTTYDAEAYHQQKRQQQSHQCVQHTMAATHHQTTISCHLSSILRQVQYC